MDWNFSSNSFHVLADITNSDEKPTDYTITDSQSIKTLVISWNAQSDSFVYHSSLKPPRRDITKRIILSRI